MEKRGEKRSAEVRSERSGEECGRDKRCEERQDKVRGGEERRGETSCEIDRCSKLCDVVPSWILDIVSMTLYQLLTFRDISAAVMTAASCALSAATIMSLIHPSFA